MIQYHLIHVGINCENDQEARKAAQLFANLFGMSIKEGENNVFASTEIECLKAPGRGACGHIAIGTSDIAAAVLDLKSRGIEVDEDSAKFNSNGTLRLIYLKDEICGFAIHLCEVR